MELDENIWKFMQKHIGYTEAESALFRKTIIIVFSILVMSVCTGVDAAESGSIVIQVRKFPEGGFLKIHAIDSFIMDAEGYLFRGERRSSGSPPDTIALHIQHDGGSHYYSAPFSTEQRRYEISAESLRPRGGAPPFRGFPPGASAFLLVGTEVGGSSLDMGVFADQWNLMLRVE